jgi:membrane associated rhomboid family serine protease
LIPIRDDVPTRRFPALTVALIAANIAVWLFYQVPHLEPSVFELGFLPCEAEHACADPGVSWPFDVITEMFAHAGWLHVFGNMLFLWIFGDNVEDAMGKIRFAAFYILAGIAATALQAAVTLGLGSPGEARIPNIGASGAIAGVLGAYFVLYPTARLVALFPFVILFVPIEVPAVLFLGFWFAFQAWQGGFSLIAPTAGGGVAFFAHIGGFLFGLLVVRMFSIRRRRRIAGHW